MTAQALELRAVRKRFGATEVLRGVDLQIARGERVAVIGPNGAGKTTLFNLISGGQRADGGHILLNGVRIDGLAPHRIHRLGLARSFQVSRLFGRLSVADNLRCAALWRLGHHHTFWRPLAALHDVNDRVDAVLSQLALVARRDVAAADLSHPQQRALEIGMALAGDAEVLLLDEPTAGMNHSEAVHITELIRSATRGRTLLTVEHDMGVVFGLADRIAVLVDGEILAFDTPAAVRADARVQASYLGAAGC